MQTAGNIDSLKKQIESSFVVRFEKFKGEATHKFNEDMKEIEEEYDVKLSELNLQIRSEEKNAFKTIQAEEKLGAKKEFADKREELINMLFDEVEKRISDKLSSQEYIDLIKSSMEDGKHTIVIAGDEMYKKHFKNVEVDKKIRGVILKNENTSFDFTYEAFINSKKSLLRNMVNNTLFGNNHVRD